MTEVTAPFVELVKVSKSFGSTRALWNVSLDVRPGEVHVIAGENGAGKSTLIRVMAGAISDFEGDLRVGGARTRFRVPDDATRAGIATIHQELSLVGSLSVVDNLFLGERGAMFAPYSSRARREDARRILQELELDVAPDALVETLPLSVRQRVEIARALHQRARVLVMDEPTSALSEPEAEQLFAEVERLRAQGTGIVFISHRMEEIFRVADRISVLRDGKLVLTTHASDLDEKRLVEAMVGRDVRAEGVAPAAERSELLLEARGLGLPALSGARPLLSDVSFTLAKGEVLGIAGLQGSGASELLQTIAGCHGRPSQGTLTLAGTPLSPSSPAEALDRGIVLLPSDRRASVFAEMSVRENATLSSLGRYASWGFLRRRAERAAVAERAEQLSLAAASLDAPVGSLSGGNQQKVALTRCLLANPRVLLLDDPTRGIDVAAKADVHALIRRLANAGTAVLMVASEMEELFASSDRVLVLFRGRRVALLDKSELDRGRVLALCMGREEVAA